MSLEIGGFLGRYEILGLLGAGGMGQVYRARDPSLDRQVAIKVLPAEVVASRDRLERFEREAKVLASLNHPHIVTIHAVEQHDSTRFFVMELIEGRTLELTLADGPLEIGRFFALALPIVDAVAVAHRRGITHRDLKPGNVMVSESGWVKVLDFGLAKDAGGAVASSSAEATAGLTRAGTILGTLPYMSPEQVQGRALGPSSDVFSLGVVLYEMATGERPFRGDNEAALISSILRDAPRTPSAVRSGLPQGLDELVACCLEKDLGRRYPTAGELHTALRKLEEDRGSGVAASVRSSLGVPVGKAYRTPLIGREEELARLREAIARTASGTGALYTLAGEPGVGKTRLVTVAMEEARALGFLTLAGNCYADEGARPFSPWAEILDAAARITRKDTLLELLGEGAPEIAKLHPGLRRLYADLPPPLQLAPAAERGYLFDCFREFIERSSRVQPLMLVLEDLHWADEATLSLLRHVSQRLATMPVLLVGTYRDVELDVARPLASALRELVRERLVSRTSLGRLDETHVAEMLAVLGGSGPPRALVSAIYGETEGNPFFVEEVYQHLAEEGRLFDGAGTWRSDSTLEDLDVPESVRLVVGRRLERLDEGARRILTAAAVMGRRFSYPLLEAVAGADPEVVLDAIEAAEQLHLIETVREAAGREARYQFAHELIRQTLVQALSLPRRQRVHLQVAEAMERVFGARVAELASQMAHHLYQAGAAASEEKTVRFLLLAADQALEAGAFEETLEHLEQAAPMLPAGDVQAQIETLWKRGRARRSLGRWQDTMADWGEALNLCERAAHLPPGVRQILATISFELSMTLIWSGRHVEATDAVQRGLRLVGQETSAERCRLLAVEGLALHLVRQLEAGDQSLTEAATMAEALAEPELRGYVSLMRMHRCDIYMQFADHVRNGVAAIEALETTRDFWNLSEARCLLRWAKVWLGRLDSQPSLEERTAERFGQHSAHTAAVDARVKSRGLERGALAQYEEDLEQLIEMARRVGMPWWTLYQATSSTVTFWHGEWERARELALGAMEHEVVDEWRGTEAAALFLIDSYLGRREEALALLETRVVLREGAEPNLVGAWLMAISGVEGLVVLGERERAAALYHQMLKAVATGTVLTLHGHHRLLQTAAGIAAAAGGQWERAEQHFETALRQAEEIPFRCEQAEARRWFAHMLLDRDAPGDAARARRYLDEAIVIYRQIGMPKHVELAAGLLQC